MRLQRKAQARSRAERTSETAAHRVERNSTSMLGSEHWGCGVFPGCLRKSGRRG